MNQMIRLLLIFVLVIASSSVGFGEVITEPVGVSPRYVSAGEVSCDMAPGLGMKLNMFAGLEPKNDSSVDEVRITLKVINFATGGVVYNKTFDAEYNYLTDYYEVRETYTAPTTGNYYMRVTYKPYKDGVLLETITQSSVVVSV